MNIEISNQANLPTAFGNFIVQTFKEGHKEHLVIFNQTDDEAPAVRIHSECLTGDALGSLKCDCGDQLAFALAYIAKHGGYVIYLRQEGRNIGLLNKINAYNLQDKGFDTIEANHQLGFKADLRTYEIVEFILEYYGVKKVKFLTNNPEKLDALKNIDIVERIPVIIKENPYNKNYLQTKKEQMGHLL